MEPNNTKIPYEKLFKVYEKDQDQIDKLVSYILKSGDAEAYQYLSGITVSDKLIGTLSSFEIELLLDSGALPTYVMIQTLKKENKVNYSLLKSLFNRYRLSSDEFVEEIKNLGLNKEHKDCCSKSFCAVVTLMAIEFDDYYGRIAFDKLEKIFIDEMYKAKSDSQIPFEQVIMAALNFLKTPYLSDHNNILDLLLEYKDPKNMDEASYNHLVQEFLCREIQRRIVESPYQMLAYLSDRKDIFRLFNGYFASIEDTLGLEKDAKEEVLRSILNGECKHTALALCLFSTLVKYRSDIMNSWIDSGMTLELDCYLDTLLDNRYDSVNSVTEFERLKLYILANETDSKYITAKETAIEKKQEEDMCGRHTYIMY